ncbi:maleylpyruvate isomerase family mycothiol-dependent enzyme [bacterium]|nr:MAG: maleylpyruvate isomerase family mycothiol-dependent enzyme [bacterium]
MVDRDVILAERQFLVKILQGLTNKQWRGDTLCAGWTVEDLAAHLIVRERGSILARAGIMLPFLHDYHDGAIKNMKQMSHVDMIERLSHPPGWVKRLSYNVVEFYVHNEDILRGDLKQARVPSDELEWALSGFVMQLGRFAFRRVEGGFWLIIHDESSGSVHEWQVGKKSQNMPELDISAPVGELTLLFMGRGRHARVDVRGSEEAKRLYRLADVGV